MWLNFGMMNLREESTLTKQTSVSAQFILFHSKMDITLRFRMYILIICFPYFWRASQFKSLLNGNECSISQWVKYRFIRSFCVQRDRIFYLLFLIHFATALIALAFMEMMLVEKGLFNKWKTFFFLSRRNFRPI